MGRVGRLSVLVLLVFGILAAGIAPAMAQLPEPPDPEDLPAPPDRVPLVGQHINDALGRALPLIENQTGEDLQTERIDLEVLLRIQNVDFGVLGFLFGGGKVEADVSAALGLDFGAVSVKRVDEALQSFTGDANISLNSTFGVDSTRLVITAEEVRLLGGGIVLDAFKAFEQDAVRRFLQDTLPGVIVLQADFDWTNTVPGEGLRNGEYELDLRGPPIHLDATVRLNYLDRYSALDVLQRVLADDNETREELAKDRLKQSIQENQTVPASQRNAFMYAGYGQLLDLNLPTGWRLNLTLEVPKGFTIESASEELFVDDEHRTASYFVDGSARTEPFSTAGVVTVSNRFVVTAALLGVVLLVGLMGRVVVEGVFFTGQASLQRLAERAEAKKDAADDSG